ncbi:MAG: cyclic lactone autoinducer peptide [Bacilli bacterium]|nr:cyclic lactone autoinducer peptide [Bacilli bacterium]
MHLLTSLLEGLGSIFANAGSVACHLFWYDEPKCPKNLIK